MAVDHLSLHFLPSLQLEVEKLGEVAVRIMKEAVVVEGDEEEEEMMETIQSQRANLPSHQPSQRANAPPEERLTAWISAQPSVDLPAVARLVRLQVQAVMSRIVPPPQQKAAAP